MHLWYTCTWHKWMIFLHWMSAKGTQPRVKQEAGTGRRRKLFVDNKAGVSFLSLCRCSLSWVTSNWRQFSQAIPPSSTLWPSRWPSQLIINIYPGTQPPKGWGEKRKRPGCSGCLCRWRRRREGGGPPGGELVEGEQGWSGTQTTLLDRFFVLLILNRKTLVTNSVRF